MSSISIIAFVIMTISIVYAFIYSSFGEITSLLDQKQTYTDSLEIVSNIEAKKAELATKFDQIPAADKKEIETILPSSLNFVKLVSDIDAVASGYGISINKITSRELSASTGDSVENAAPDKPYNSAIIGFSFTASYDKFYAFLGDLEKSLRILDVRSVKLTTADNGVYTYDVEFETYWVK